MSDPGREAMERCLAWSDGYAAYFDKDALTTRAARTYLSQLESDSTRMAWLRALGHSCDRTGPSRPDAERWMAFDGRSSYFGATLDDAVDAACAAERAEGGEHAE